jgi:hypothetical protein
MGYVYIYRSGDRNVFKIGKASDLEKRLKAHATGNPEPLTRFDVIETDHPSQVETYMHHRLRSRRYTRGDGTEWFEVEPDELEAVIADARQYDEEVLPAIARAEELSVLECDGTVLTPTDGVMDTYRELVKVREEYETLGYRKAHLETQLKLVIGTASGIDRVANWLMVAHPSFDSITLRAELPDIYKRYARETRSRTFTLL